MDISRYLIVLVSLVSLASSSLVVYKPSTVAANYPEQFSYTIANFGHIPYGKTLVGRVVVASPANMCEVDGSIEQKRKSDPNTPLFMLIERGMCKFTNKTFNAQKSGAALSIIVDTNNSESGGIVMANDGFGFLVEIPSIFVSNSSGETLKRLAKESGDELILRIKFDTEKSDVVRFRMWLDASNWRVTQTTGTATS